MFEIIQLNLHCVQLVFSTTFQKCITCESLATHVITSNGNLRCVFPALTQTSFQRDK